VRTETGTRPTLRFLVSFFLPILHAWVSALRPVWAKFVGHQAIPRGRTGLAGQRFRGVPDHAGLVQATSCARLIGRARWRARLRRHDARLAALLALADERLGDLDETLLRCHPVRDAALFAEAARLHREVERIRASIPPAKRRRLAPSFRVDARAFSERRSGVRPRAR